MNSIDDSDKSVEKTENKIVENLDSSNESPKKHEDRVPEMNNIGFPVCSTGMNSNEVLDSSVAKDKTENDKSEPDEWLDVLESGQVKKKTLKPGKSGEKPPKNGICRLNIVSALEDGTVVEEFKDLTIQVGDFEVIQGLDLTIPLMEVGEICSLQVGPRFAYGARGREPDIPSNATLIYTVELISAEEAPEVYDLSPSELEEQSNKKQERGDWWASRGEYTLAVHCYRQAQAFQWNRKVQPYKSVEISVDDLLQDIIPSEVDRRMVKEKVNAATDSPLFIIQFTPGIEEYLPMINKSDIIKDLNVKFETMVESYDAELFTSNLIKHLCKGLDITQVWKSPETSILQVKDPYVTSVLSERFVSVAHDPFIQLLRCIMGKQLARRFFVCELKCFEFPVFGRPLSVW